MKPKMRKDIKDPFVEKRVQQNSTLGGVRRRAELDPCQTLKRRRGPLRLRSGQVRATLKLSRLAGRGLVSGRSGCRGWLRRSARCGKTPRRFAEDRRW